jgi:hypothetical protein
VEAPRGGGGGGSDGGVEGGLSKSDVSFALTSLEREKARLEEQLRLVNTHIAAYRQLEGRPRAAAVMPPNGNSMRHSSALASRADVSGPVSPPPPRRETGTVSPSRRGGRSPPRGSIQTEQIYEELRQIRRAREEREAQRRAAAGAASPTRL